MGGFIPLMVCVVFILNQQICTWCKKAANADLPAQAKAVLSAEKIRTLPKAKNMEKW